MKCVRSPEPAPDGSVFAESWIGRFKLECWNHFLCFGHDHLAPITGEYVRFFNQRRLYQGLGNVTPAAASSGPPVLNDSSKSVQCAASDSGRLAAALLPRRGAAAPPDSSRIRFTNAVSLRAKPAKRTKRRPRTSLHLKSR